jgi:PEP-CTERM motif
MTLLQSGNSRSPYQIVLTTVFALGIVVSGVASPVWAGTITTTTTVQGTEGPWLQSANPSYNYGVGDNAAPDVINAASGISFAAGGTITVTYLSGTVSAGTAFPFVDANGDTSFAFNNNAGSSGKYAPSYFMDPATYPIYLVELVGTFADNGIIVGNPFAIGDGPTNLTIPAGANELLLGSNDDIYSDNVGSWTLDVTGPQVSTTPEPASILLLAIGLLAVAGWRRYRFTRA